MPASYAHYRFGREVLALLPEELQRRLNANRGLFDIGLHGPDVFFYYHPLWDNPISQVGYAMHERPGREVFRRFAAIWEKGGRDEAEWAYLCGFLCHFALDSSCHGYVDEMAAMGVSHTLLEMELDRSLLVSDGLDPVKHDLVRHIHPSSANARVVARFFPQVTERQAEAALKGMIQGHHLLMAENRPKRLLLEGGIALMGKQDSLGGMVMSEAPSRACRKMVERLREMYREALPLAAALIEAFPGLENPQYSRDFEGQTAARSEDL